ncbi:MAG: ATP-binding protein [Verrucomicrobiota bacterium]
MEQSSNPAQVLSPPTQESVLRTLIDTMPDIIYAKDLQSRFIMCNVALARLVGAHDLQSLLGKTDADFFPPALAKQYLADERAILETGMPMLNREEPTIGVDGLERWDSSTKIPIRDTNQRVCGLVGITRDITEQKRASELLEQTNAALQNANEQLKAAQFQLIQFEKAQSLSRLAAGLAHEIKNPLAILEMGVSFLADELGTQENKEVVASMHEAITRANQIISNVMGLADNNTLSLDRHPLGPIAEDAIREIHPILENTGIRLTIEQPTEELSALVDPPELKRVLVNILTNSIQAIPPTAREGLISIKISKHTLGPEISHDSGNRSGQRFRSGDKIATIEIEDNGCGIAEENRSAIFDAFFTTKSTGTAVGLGLTVSRKIIELHGGTIEIAPRKDGGTIVSLRLKS